MDPINNFKNYVNNSNIVTYSYENLGFKGSYVMPIISTNKSLRQEKNFGVKYKNKDKTLTSGFINKLITKLKGELKQQNKIKKSSINQLANKILVQNLKGLATDIQMEVDNIISNSGNTNTENKDFNNTYANSKKDVATSINANMEENLYESARKSASELFLTVHKKSNEINKILINSPSDNQINIKTQFQNFNRNIKTGKYSKDISIEASTNKSNIKNSAYSTYIIDPKTNLNKSNKNHLLSPTNIKIPYNIKTDNLSIKLNEELSRVSHNYGKIHPFKINKNEIEKLYFDSNNYLAYRTNKINVNKQFYRPKLMPLKIEKDSGIERLANSIFNLKNIK